MATRERFSHLATHIRHLAEEFAFKALGVFVERHGSWEMVLCKRTDLDRFVIIYLVPRILVPGSPTWYQIEFWAGAEQGQRFTRRLVAQLADSEPTLERGEISQSVELFATQALRAA